MDIFKGLGLNEKLLDSADLAEPPDELERFKVAQLKARLPTMFVIGKLMQDVLADGSVNENDSELLNDFLSRQQEVWNQIMVVSTLMVSFTFGETHSDLATDPENDERTGGMLTTAYACVITMSHVMFVATTMLCALLYAYSKVIFDLRDIVWFFSTAPHQLPIIMMLGALGLYFVSGVISALLTHAHILGSALALMWSVTIVWMAWMWWSLKSSMMRRWTNARRLKRKLSQGAVIKSS